MRVSNKSIIYVFLLFLHISNSYARTVDSLFNETDTFITDEDIDTTNIDSSQDYSQRVIPKLNILDTIVVQPKTQQSTQALDLDFEKNWNMIDSARIFNPFLFYSKNKVMESDEVQPILNSPVTNYNYYYVLFFLFVILIILYSRLYPFNFKLQLKAFFNRAGLSELLASDKEWFETSKFFPFVISAVFYSSFIVSPLLNYYSVKDYSYLVVFIGVLMFVLFYFLLRLSQTVLSTALDFVEIMSTFFKASLNSIYILSIFSFPTIIVLLSFLHVNIFEQRLVIVLIILVLYVIRTVKSFSICLRYEQRQIIYLIIYLCTLEVLMLLYGIKWIYNYI